MKKLVNIIICSSIIVSSAIAGEKSQQPTSQALSLNTSTQQSSLYFGGAFSYNKIDTYKYSNNLKDITALFGYNLTNYLDIEARFLKSAKDGDELTHTYSYALFLKPKVNLKDNLYSYALLGYSANKITYENEAQYNGILNNYTIQKSVSYGLGFSYKVNSKWSLFADMVRYIDDNITKPEGKYAIKIDSISFGFNYQF
jgi:hypothetical protein